MCYENHLSIISQMLFRWIQGKGPVHGTAVSTQSGSADASLTPSVTHFGVNTLALEIAGKRILIDPLLVGSLDPWKELLGTQRVHHLFV